MATADWYLALYCVFSFCSLGEFYCICCNSYLQITFILISYPDVSLTPIYKKSKSVRDDTESVDLQTLPVFL